MIISWRTVQSYSLFSLVLLSSPWWNNRFSRSSTMCFVVKIWRHGFKRYWLHFQLNGPRWHFPCAAQSDTLIHWKTQQHCLFSKNMTLLLKIIHSHCWNPCTGWTIFFKLHLIGGGRCLLFWRKPLMLTPYPLQNTICYFLQVFFLVLCAVVRCTLAKDKIVPLYNGSEQGLWIILISVMSSGKKCWLFLKVWFRYFEHLKWSAIWSHLGKGWYLQNNRKRIFFLPGCD